MIWFPQTNYGTIAQIPVGRSRGWRTIGNDLENGEAVSLPDAYAGEINWRLSYQDLSDAETASLSGLFSQVNGRAGWFAFVDPLANLLAWSEDLIRPDWQAGQLQLASGVADPFGTTRAWSLTNGAGAPQSLQQTLSLPSGYTACFSAWARSSVPCPVLVTRDTRASSLIVGSAWKRFAVTWTGSSGADESTFGIALAAGQQLELFGPQTEAQPYPSPYKYTVAARGIYQETRFAADDLNIVATGVGRSACQVTLISRV